MPRKPTPPRRRAPSARANPVALRLLALQEDERRRIARLLHDDLGQTLTAAVLELEYARGGADDAAQAIDAVVVELRRLLGAARDLSLSLRPALIDEEGLPAALGALASRLSGVRGAAVAWSCDTAGVEVPPLLGVCAFRTLQDELFPRAAPGARLSMAVAVRAGLLRVEARGPTGDRDPAREAAIADRVAAAGGRVRRSTRAGEARLVAEFPLPARRGAAARPA
jgi:signal transduction histidine kinase